MQMQTPPTILKWNKHSSKHIAGAYKKKNGSTTIYNGVSQAKLHMHTPMHSVLCNSTATWLRMYFYG